jgi:hypothetical protein
MRAQLVPPTPATSMVRTPMRASCSRSRAEMPQPISFAITGTSSSRATFGHLGSRLAKLPLPSGCSASCSGFRCSTNASAPIISTARRQCSTP